MAPLRGLSCTLTLACDGKPLPEHSPQYQDGLVDSWLEVPDKALGVEPSRGHFCITLSSDEYIASGIAMFVYIDGIYQCNKTVVGIQAEDGTRAHFDISASGHQSFLSDSSIVERPWRFQRVEHQDALGSAGLQPPRLLPFQGKYAGTVDVLVKRIGPVDKSAVAASPFRMPPGGLAYFDSPNSENNDLSQARSRPAIDISGQGVENAWSKHNLLHAGMFPFSVDAQARFPPSNDPDPSMPDSVDYLPPEHLLKQGVHLNLHLDKSTQVFDKIVQANFIDPPGKCFAMFHFKYRDTRSLEHILQIKLQDPEAEREQTRLASLDKEALMKEILGLKRALQSASAPAFHSHGFQNGQQVPQLPQTLVSQMRGVLEASMNKGGMEAMEMDRLRALHQQLRNLENPATPSNPTHAAQAQHANQTGGIAEHASQQGAQFSGTSQWISEPSPRQQPVQSEGLNHNRPGNADVSQFIQDSAADKSKPSAWIIDTENKSRERSKSKARRRSKSISQQRPSNSWVGSRNDSAHKSSRASSGQRNAGSDWGKDKEEQQDKGGGGRTSSPQAGSGWANSNDEPVEHVDW